MTRRRGWFARTPRALPKAFLFGVANSDHQTEAYEERVADIRDLWETRRGQTPRGRATDFWNRYPEDVRLAQGLGCGMFRFSVAWSRVEPQPGVFDAEALAHYLELAEHIRAAGMEPMVTLLHFTWPTHVEQRGGMTADGFPALFARYAAEVAGALGPQVRYWVTINEPTLLPFGYLKPWWQSDYEAPPGLPPHVTLADQVDAVGKLIRNLFLAHAAARTAIRDANPDALVGANPALLGLPPWLQRLADRNARRVGGLEGWVRRERRFAERPLLGRPSVDLLVAAVTPTPERAGDVDFSAAYITTGLTLLVPQTSAVHAVADVGAGPLAVLAETTAEAVAAAVAPSAAVQRFDSHEKALAALDAGHAVALLSDEPLLRVLAQASPDRYRLTGGLLQEQAYSVAVPKGHTELLKAVDRGLQEFVSSGGWTSSLAQHFAPDPPSAPPPAGADRTLADLRATAEPAAAGDAGRTAPARAADTSLSRIRKRGRVVIAVTADVPGLGYRDPATGEWSGFEVDLARAVGRSVVGEHGAVTLRPLQAQARLSLSLLRPLLRPLDWILRPLSVCSTIVATNWWNLGLAGELPERLCPRECVGALDFVGFDYYWGLGSLRLGRVHHLVQALTAGRYDVAPVWPRGLALLLRAQSKLFPGKPIFVVENGCVVVADGVDRAAYLRRHIREVQRARQDGVDVAGYVCWSITSNREWGLHFGPNSDFGLYHVDLDTDPELVRRRTPAADEYEAIVGARSA